MLDTNRHQHFKKVIYDLLSSQETVAVLKVNDKKAARPHCYISSAMNDDYEPVRGDAGAIGGRTGRHVFNGIYEFEIYARFDVANVDVAQEGTLEDEGADIIEALEWALKYGDGSGDERAPFVTDRYRIVLHQVLPHNARKFADPQELFGMVRIVGTIEYTQYDL